MLDKQYVTSILVESTKQAISTSFPKPNVLKNLHTFIHSAWNVNRVLNEPEFDMIFIEF